jgi:selenocysteine-specific elongation factor
MRDLILGTAGHIDHGKTSLIRALTGVDTDRLPEEKKRGITIELGFAELELGDVRLGIVDVPGHERFVRNMLAGATGIDVALLVVAADDSVKPQTREHLDILRLLDLSSGVIALTKCDVADADWIDLVETEVRDLTAGTFLKDAPLVRTSAHTGEGIDALKTALTDAAARASENAVEGGPFRMAIDRTFSIAGHGAVVTGSVQSGAARLGDVLVIEPVGIEVRVRGLQNHDRTVEEIHRGQRAAINLAGVHHDQLGRGQELASAGHLKPSTLITARLDLLPSANRPLKNRTRVRVHVGTAELLASVVLLSCERLEPGESGFVQFYLREPAVTVWNQPLVVRSESPVHTIGGGVVLDPAAGRLRRSESQRIARVAELGSADPLVRASAALYFAGLSGWRPADLARTAGVADFDAAAEALRAGGDLVEIELSPTRRLSIHRRTLEELGERAERVLTRLHAEFPLQRSIERTRLEHQFRYLESPALLDKLLEQMAADGRVQLSARGIALAGHGPQLSKREQQLIEEIIAQFRAAGLKPPSVADVRKAATRNQASVPQLVALAAAEGSLVQISPDIFLHAESEQQLRATLAEELSGGKGLTMSEIREHLATTRKYAVPICEYLDQAGFTRREGDLRYLAE